MIKRGDIVYIKTTAEPVYILDVVKSANPDWESETRVRRLNLVTGHYIQDRFYLDELETREEARNRFKAEQQELYGKIESKTPSVN